jgi:hypothetical protein
MLFRKEHVSTQIDKFGNVIELKFIDGGILAEDQIIMFAKSSLYKVATGTESPLENLRDAQNFLVRLYVDYK